MADKAEDVEGKEQETLEFDEVSEILLE